MIARSCSLTAAGFRYIEERDTANNRHCCETGSAGF
jgi:hypothetical protein